MRHGHKKAHQQSLRCTLSPLSLTDLCDARATGRPPFSMHVSLSPQARPAGGSARCLRSPARCPSADSARTLIASCYCRWIPHGPYSPNTWSALSLVNSPNTWLGISLKSRTRARGKVSIRVGLLVARPLQPHRRPPRRTRQSCRQTQPPAQTHTHVTHVTNTARMHARACLRHSTRACACACACACVHMRMHTDVCLHECVRGATLCICMRIPSRAVE